MRRFALVCLPLAALLLAGSAVAFAALRPAPGSATGAAPGEPGAFVKRLITQIVRDDYARAWLTLHPVHKAVAPRWTYVDCELLTPVPGDIVSIRIVRVAGERMPVAGAGRLATKAVTFELRLREPGVGTVDVTHTSHLVDVRGHWRWILTPERYALYRGDACGGGAPAA